jgi:hypothetical protein
VPTAEAITYTTRFDGAPPVGPFPTDSPTKTTLTNLQFGTYDWQLQVHSDCCTWSSFVNRVNVTIAKSPKPNASVHGPSVKFGWSLVPGEAAYDVGVFSDAACTALALGSIHNTGKSATIDFGAMTGTFYWKIVTKPSNIAMPCLRVDVHA